MKNIPKVIMTYFKAVSDHDFDMIETCFTRDATVHDEKRDYKGVKEIRAWLEEAAKKYGYRSLPLSAKEKDGELIVKTRLIGNFPGSPVEVEYIFTLQDEKISSLIVD